MAFAVHLWAEPVMNQLDRIEAALISVEAKLDALIDALAEEDEQLDLEGNEAAIERDPLEPL